MPVKVKASTKSVAKKEKKTAVKKVQSSTEGPKIENLIRARPKNFGIGQDVPYARDISRFMRWPVFVSMQRKKRVLLRRLKVPPTINQFSHCLDRTTRNEVLKLVSKYAPESRKDRNARLKKAAAEKKENSKQAVVTKPPLSVVFGIQEVTRLIEKNTARLVLIASNVEPLELILWMPTLCRKNHIPYAIVKDKARLGEAIGMKTATCVAFTGVNSGDEDMFKKMIKSINARFLAHSDIIRKRWGGRQLSLRSSAALRKRASKAKGNKVSA